MTVVKHAGDKGIAQSFLSCAYRAIVIVSSASTSSAVIVIAASTAVWASSSSSTHDNVEKINIEKC